MDATSSHRLLVTGGAGFIGSIFIRHILREFPHWHVLCFDALTYAGNLHNLDDVNSHPHFQFTRGDVTDSTKVAQVFSNFLPDVVVHFAAETHVDRGIKDPEPFCVPTFWVLRFCWMQLAEMQSHALYISPPMKSMALFQHRHPAQKRLR